MTSNYLLLNDSNVVSCVKYRQTLVIPTKVGIQYFWLLRTILDSCWDDSHFCNIT